MFVCVKFLSEYRLSRSLSGFNRINIEIQGLGFSELFQENRFIC